MSGSRRFMALRLARRLTTLLVIIGFAVSAAPVAPALADGDPPITFTDAQLTSALFTSAIRIKEPGDTYDKDVIASAELLDWRQTNPTANGAAVDSHVQALRAALAGQPTDQKVQSRPEVWRWLMKQVYATPGMEITGRWMTDLLGVVPGRDLTQALPSKELRLTGAQQGLDLVEGVPATSVQIGTPDDVVIDTAGNVYFLALGHVVKVGADGIVHSVAGVGQHMDDPGYQADCAGDSGPGTLAEINFPQQLALDAAGNIYLATCNRVRKITVA